MDFQFVDLDHCVSGLFRVMETGDKRERERKKGTQGGEQGEGGRRGGGAEEREKEKERERGERV